MEFPINISPVARHLGKSLLYTLLWLICGNCCIISAPGSAMKLPHSYTDVFKVLILCLIFLHINSLSSSITEYEFDIIRSEVRRFRELGAQGVVIGMLRPDGSLDMEHLAQLMEEAKGMSVTLHRAFDVCRDPMEALEQVISLGFNTILTSGQKNNCVDGSPLLAELVEKSAGRIHIMAGAGVNADVIAPIYEKTGITDYHMTGKVLLDSEMKYRKEGVSMGLPSLSEYEIFRTSEAEVKKAREVLARL